MSYYQRQSSRSFSVGVSDDAFSRQRTSLEDKKPFSVSEALNIVKGSLKNIKLMIVGEVSEVAAKRSYKAVYFTIKDKSAALSCLMWNDLYDRADIQLEVGQQVEITGFFSVYAARGTMNFDVRNLSLAGQGKLRLEVARLAKKLEAEGLMDPARKRSLPAFPQIVGVVTSPHGDAIHDILRTLRRRWPVAKVVVAGVQVEGVNAAQYLIQGLQCIAESGAQLVILGRGGGSYENMMPFNDENLARAIVACPIPVVTGIGHEPDNFIADMVADVRTSTPTLAAVAAVPDAAEIRTIVASQQNALNASIKHRLNKCMLEVQHLSDRPVLRDAQSLFAQESMAVDHLVSRLERVMPSVIDGYATSLDVLSSRLSRALPVYMKEQHDLFAQLCSRLQRALGTAAFTEKVALDRQNERMQVIGSAILDRFKQQMSLRAARLNDLSPLAILARGYAVARSDEGGIVKSIHQVQTDDALLVQVSDGVLNCIVKGSHEINMGLVRLDE